MVFHPDDYAQELWRPAFNRAISCLEYGDASEYFKQSFTALSDHEVFDWSHAVRWMKASGSQRQEIFAEVKTEDVPAANLALKKALKTLQAVTRFMPPEKRTCMQALELAADGIRIWYEIAVYIRHTYYKHSVPQRAG